MFTQPFDCLEKDAHLSQPFDPILNQILLLKHLVDCIVSMILV